MNDLPCEHFESIDKVGFSPWSDDVAYCHECNVWAFYSVSVGWIPTSGNTGKRMSAQDPLRRTVFLLTPYSTTSYAGGPLLPAKGTMRMWELLPHDDKDDDDQETLWAADPQEVLEQLKNLRFLRTSQNW